MKTVVWTLLLLSAGICYGFWDADGWSIYPGPRAGRLRISYDNRWGTACDDEFDWRDARVACRSLGLPYQNARVLSPSAFGPGSGKIWLDNLGCNGYEASINDCSGNSWGDHNCDHSEDVGIICTDVAGAIPTRLSTNSYSKNSGPLEVFYNGTWGSVCDGGFGFNEAKVVCRSLGYETIYARAVHNSGLGKGSEKKWLNYVKCSGNEKSIELCSAEGWGAKCGPYNVVGVICHTVPPVRLVPGPNKGRLEVYRAGVWGTVCSDSFSYHDARVACNMLGLEAQYANVLTSDVTEAGTGQIWLDDLGCREYHLSYSTCPHRGWGNHNCNHSRDIGVECRTVAPIRLVPGPSLGRLEVNRGNNWGTVCDDNFSKLAAMVVCRSLGYVPEYAFAVNDLLSRVVFDVAFGPGTGKIWLDDVTCMGNETSIDKCSHRYWGQTDCSHLEDVGVICPEVLPIRLVPGPREGRVEVMLHEDFGTVCDHNFAYSDAEVVCRSLRLPSVYAQVGKTISSLNSSSKIWMDGVNCDGEEITLGDCKHRGWGVHNCSHSDDVAVRCNSEVPTRLNPGPHKGILEVYRRGVWGSVCDVFSFNDAKVVCRNLGFEPVYAEATRKRSMLFSLMDNVRCYGNESSLEQCSHRWQASNRRCYGYIVEISCHQTVPSRLIPGPTKGRVEVYREGVWGTVCDDNFGYEEAAVVCRSLGLTSTYAQAVPNALLGSGYGVISLDDVICEGIESTLASCRHNRWGVGDCSHDEDVGVKCHSDALVRLVPGPTEGRLEMYREGVWGTVCDDDFSYVDAKVACRSLGLSVDYAEVVRHAGSGAGSGKIWLDDVQCYGSELSISKCRHRYWGYTNCGHDKDVQVKCNTLPPIRLAPGPRKGRVEVYRHGVWGTVCDHYFTYEDAKVVCRSLGLKLTYAEVVPRADSGTGLSKIWLDDIGCKGSETSLSQCSHGGWSVVNCDHSGDVWVTCHESAPIRLVPGPDSGQIQIYRQGVWKSVCTVY